MIAQFRFPGEIHYLQEFVRPEGYMVQEVCRQYGGLPPEEQVFQLWDYVCREIDYPLTAKGEYTDYHRMDAFLVVDIPLFGPRFRVSQSSEEFFQFPAETLSWKIGDCDCTSVLLASLLRNVLPAKRVQVAIGTFRGYGHAWVTVDQLILETTLRAATGVQPELDGAYRPLYLFNDQEAVAVGEAKRPGKDQEVKKLAEIGKLWQRPTKGPK